MTDIFVIGIGAGGADLLTVQAIDALRATDVFLIFDKGEEKAELSELRKQICARYCTEKPYRFVEISVPERDPALPYKQAVAVWHAARAARVADEIAALKARGETGAFLSWGDPSLYDSILRIIDGVRADGAVQFEHTVIPGISSIQILTARHRIALNAIGEPVLFTTGRKLAERFPEGQGNVVVFLDGGDGLASLRGRAGEIFWGAYLGTADEVTHAGPIDTVLDSILEQRQACRARKGWIMDVYLIRPPQPA
ncbi:precorrin-6A synthase (deacetylating) [Hyphomicrobium sulfonivorans]|uniref:precorrin-6A synthase (deacetylating) n=1 Tax=Hyphomicrobium sulfonivorans TaxID=121290 RepID=UPI001570C009|nr:precorrin-6A synthase (deacetylating) [Hyphomicrobium sulfonivorans]MBI1650902.1 precorrin-6A synthase (deacetylating) [Hyphomicrobium sulfonivorans]NSL72715.1 precorrin-6A synthase (deacetylating) [Hyphomicrobium sulfonivorans]